MTNDEKNSNNQSRKTLNLALYYLSRRARTKKEIEQKLALKGFEEAEIAKVIKQLLDWKFINDFEFAKSFIRTSKLGNPKGRRRIAFELQRKGVEKSLIATAIEEELGDDESDLVFETLQKYLKKNSNIERAKIYNRAISYLLRRGFSYDEAKRAYKKLNN